jgi:hypothetical protein
VIHKGNKVYLKSSKSHLMLGTDADLISWVFHRFIKIIGWLKYVLSTDVLIITPVPSTHIKTTVQSRSIWEVPNDATIETLPLQQGFPTDRSNGFLFQRNKWLQFFFFFDSFLILTFILLGSFLQVSSSILGRHIAIMATFWTSIKHPEHPKRIS